MNNIAHLTDSAGRPSNSQSDSDHVRRLARGGRPLSVLIVEDERLVGEFFAESIEEYGGQVVGIAATPVDAFGLVVEHKPDVVVMDIRLEDDHDGLRVADAMRILYQTPIVFCTGYGDAETVERIRQFGGDSPLLFKPVLEVELCEAILKACGC